MTVEQFGAKIIASNSIAVVHPRNLSVTTSLPSMSELESSSTFLKGASYIFTNSKPTSTQGLVDLGVFDDEDVMKQMVASGANLYKEIADDFFSRKQSKLLSPTPNNKAQIIVEKSKEEQVTKSNSRTFLSFSGSDMANARKIVAREFEGADRGASAKSEQDIFNEGMEFLLLSALYRGYDIAIDSSFNSEVVASAINRYNKHLKAKDKKVVFASSLRTGSNIVRTKSVNSLVDNLDSAVKSSVSVDDYSLYLNNLFSASERKTFDIYKAPSLTSRLVVANRVINIFRDMMPNLEAQILSSQEIRATYGPSFANKKGFIIDGTIVLNQERFDSTTLFHEFGHYYSRWLAEYKPEAHSALMENIQNNYDKEIPGYSSMYQATGLKHSNTDIIEEVFVDHLGMAAAKKLDALIQGIDPEDSASIAKSVDEFAEDFLRKLTKNRTIDMLATGFSLNSSISDIFNIGMQHSSALNPTSLAVYDQEHMKSFKEFFIQKASARDIFQGLVGKGLVRGVGNDNDIILFDALGNRVDIHGEQDDAAVYKFYPWDTVKGVRSNNDFLNKAEAYLDKNKNFASVRFSISQKPQTVVDIINQARGGLELTEDGEFYLKNGVKHDRVTHYLQDQFSAKAESEMYILNAMYSEYHNNYLTSAKTLNKVQDVDLANKAFEATKAFMDNENSVEFKKAYKAIASKFEFKTNEGTYLHAIAETYLRALNYSKKIEYKNGDENRGLTHYAKHIKEGISTNDITKFDSFFETYFFNHLQGEEGTPEYKAFKENYEFLRKEMGDRATSQVPARDFIRLLDEKVIPVLNKLKGPITIMPEVKLSSAKLGVAGTIDLLVIDGEGRAHIFDYKTKEEGKEVFWDWSQGTNMKGVMGAYRENAMMKASVQTSIYKLMLMELGIQTGRTAVFYVESSTNGASNADFLKENAVRYSPLKIYTKGLIDVSAELLQHFSANNRKPDIDMNTSNAADISKFIVQASGGYDIDMATDLEKYARRIYDIAVDSAVNSSKTSRNLYMAERALTKGLAGSGAVGLKIRIGKVKRTLDADLTTEEEQIAAIVELLKNKENLSSLSSQMESIFNGQDRHSIEYGAMLSSQDVDTGLRALVRGADSASHELTRLASNATYGTEYSNIELLRNKITGENRLIIVNHDEADTYLKFGIPSRGNIFGKYWSNNRARIAESTINWKNTTHNMRLIKAGLVMIEQKQADKDFNVSIVISNNGLEKNSNVPNLHDVSSILRMTKRMIEAMRDSGEEVPASILNALKRPELFESRSYIKNPIESLSSYLEMTSGDYLRLEDMFKKGKAKENKKELAAILKNYDPNQDSHKLIDALHNFRNSMSGKLTDTRQRYTNDLWTLTDQVIMHLMGFNHTISPKNTDFINNFLMTTSKMSNTFGAAFNRKIQGSAADIRSEFMEYKNEHNKLIKALAEAKGVNISQWGPAMFKSSMKVIYKDLYTTDNTQRGSAFILKDPSQVHTQAEKDYLIYLKKTFQKFADISTYKDVTIPHGWMPLIRKSRVSADADMDIIESTKERLRGFDFNRPISDTNSARPLDDEFTTESEFVGQLPNAESSEEYQYTFARRQMLSLDPLGEETANADENPLSSVEDNIANVVDAFALAALETFHYKDVSEFGRSLFYTIKRHEELGKVELNGIIETVALIQRRVINHKESDGNNKVIKSLNKFATNAAIAGTISQALLETFTNPLVTASNYFGDKLYGVMFGGAREFSAKSYTTAFNLVAFNQGKEKDIINAIDMTYGIATSDTASLKEMMNVLENKNIFQSKNLMFVNHLMMSSWQKITMVAYMIEQGTFYAHSLDEDGNLVYDETKDKRFHFANAGEDPKIVREKKLFYDATKAELAKHRNGLNQDSKTDYEKRTLKKAWTTFDSNYVKEMIVELYSSLDDTSKSLATYYTWMGFIAKMRTWLFSKIPRYFQKPMTAEENESASRLVKVIDESSPDGYRFEWKGEPTEGILYTIWSMAQQLAEHKTSVLKNGTLNVKQKKNLSMLMSDLLVFSILGAAASGIFKYALDDETREDEMVKLVYERWSMATGDVFVLKSIYDMTTGTGSMFIGVSIASRFLKSMVETAIIAPQVLIDPETTMEDFKSAAHNLAMSSYGPFKTVDIVAKAMSADE